jgi:hypothetical protein
MGAIAVCFAVFAVIAGPMHSVAMVNCRFDTHPAVKRQELRQEPAYTARHLKRQELRQEVKRWKARWDAPSITYFVKALEIEVMGSLPTGARC